MNLQPTRVAVYGVGNFGFAFLKHFDEKADVSLEVSAYDRDAALRTNLQRHRRHLYLHTDVELTDHVRFCESEADLVEGCDILVLAVSSDATREVLRSIRPLLRPGVIVLNTAKALDVSTGQRLSSVVEQELGDLEHSYALVAGGTIAKDLFRHEPLGVDIASSDDATLALLKPVLESDNLWAYPTSDLLGVEYASALKSVIAVCAGIVNGLGFSYGSETHVISRVAHDIGKLCVDEMGAAPETFGVGSQCWGNDMWMSCTGASRNREFGTLLGHGKSVEEATATMASARKTVEALNTIAVLDRTPLREVPMVALIYELVAERSIGMDQIRAYLLKK